VSLNATSTTIDTLTVNTTITVPNNSFALGTKTTGNYAAGDAEAGNALTGDSATGFFSAGQIEAARGGTGIDSSGSTGIAVISSGTWSASSTLSVVRGGTGVVTLTDGGVLFGGGTSPITASAVLTNGQLLIGDGSGVPTLATLTGTANEIDITNGAGSITIGIVDPLIVGKGGTGAATLPSTEILVGNGTSAITSTTTVSVVRGGTGVATLASNGVLYGNGTSPILATTAGTSGQLLQANSSGVPTFVTISSDVTLADGGAVTIANNSVDGTDIALGSDVAGDIMYYNGTDYVRLGIGSAGQVLEVNSGGTAPEWDTDDTAAGGGAPGAWEVFSANVLRPTNTASAILVNAASSTITQLIANRATSTEAFWSGTGGTANTLDLTGGDLYVQDDLEVDGTITGNLTGDLTGNASTASALAANGGNCSAGNAPLGVDALGAVESCFDVWTEAENTTAGYIANITGENIGDLSDVNTAGAAINNILMWDGTNWIDQATTTQIHDFEIDTYSELNVIVSDATLTHNGLIDTYSELNTIVADVTLTHNGLIDTFSELDAIVADASLFHNALTATLSGDLVFTGTHVINTASTTITGTLNVGDRATTSALVIGTTLPPINPAPAGTLFVGGGATTTNLAVTGLTDASCDVKATTDGVIYCGTDATGASSGAAWEQIWTNAITPTRTTDGIFVRASSTIDSTLRVNSTLIVPSGEMTLNGIAYTLPVSDGSNGHVLHTDGAGALSWSADTTGGGTSTTTFDVVVDGSVYPNTMAGIEAAIADLPAGGGIVYLPAGTYALEGDIDIGTAGTTLMGSGTTTVLSLNNTVNANVITVAASNVTIKNLSINGNKANNITSLGIQFGMGLSSLSVDRVSIWNTDDRGIFFNGDSHVSVTNSRFASIGQVGDTASAGVEFYNTAHGKIIGNTFDWCESDCIFLAGDGTANSGTHDYVIANNYVSGTQENQASAIMVWEGYDGVISGNHVYELASTTNGVNGIYARSGLYSAGTDAQTVITGNTVIRATGIGIESQGTGVVITGNTIADFYGSGTDSEGIYVWTGGNTVISGNFIASSTNYGIYLENPGPNTVISGNTIRDSQCKSSFCADNNAAAVRINSNASNVTITGNQMYDTKTTPSQIYGVLCAGTGNTNLQIHGNDIRASSADVSGCTDGMYGGWMNYGVATSTLAMWLGSGGIANSIDLQGGDLYVQDDIEIDGTLFVADAQITGGVITGITDLVVADGGTGASSLTDGGVLVGSGTAAITALSVGTNGQLLVGSTGADPVFATLNCAGNLTCTTGAGTLQIDVDDSYVFLAGDSSSGNYTWTGSHDYGGGIIEIPNGTGVISDAIGEINLDTAANTWQGSGGQLIVATSTDAAGAAVVGRVLTELYSFTFASTSAIVSGDILDMPVKTTGFRVVRIQGYVENGTSQVFNLSDGTNDTNSFTIASDPGQYNSTTQNFVWNPGEKIRVEWSTNTGSVEGTSITVVGYYLRE